MSSLYELLEGITHQLPGCRLASVVQQETGMPLVSIGGDESLDSAGVDAYHGDLYQVIGRALGELSFEESVQGVVLTGKHAIFVSVPLDDTGFFWHVATDRSTTVGFTQAVMRKHATSVQHALLTLLGQR